MIRGTKKAIKEDENLKKFFDKVREKKRMYAAAYKNQELELITRGSPTVRINAARNRERIVAYNELLELAKSLNLIYKL